MLEDISFAVDHGKTLAIVGRTGSGKSTLINLIPRLLSAPEGTLFINGTDINHISLSSLRSSIGFVPQETFPLLRYDKEQYRFLQRLQYG